MSNQKIISHESKLMNQILAVRYTDLEEEKSLCKQLLQIAEEQQYFYGIAFANVYLMDCHLALGEYASCNFFLLRARVLCRENGFDDLMMMLCNCAGLYYQKLNDDQTALSYFLEGKKLADKLEDIGMAAKFYNNVGYAFGYRKDWETGKMYFQHAYEAVEQHLEDENITSAVNYLSNLAEACENIGDDHGARHALELCEALDEDSIYSRIRFGCSWCAYYVLIGDWLKCANEADKIIADMSSVEDQFFVCDMAEGLCSNMLDMGDCQRAGLLIDIIEKMTYDESISLRFRILCLKIRYWEQLEENDHLENAYKEYYDIARQITILDDEMLMQSLHSKIEMNQAKQEQLTMQQKNRELENASQLDELTGLYNRRYFNKLVSKAVNREEIKSMGFIMVDVDYFKQYNDFYGHFKGDDALRTVADVLSHNATSHIYVSRYGGDEFICLCLNLEDQDIEDYIQQMMGDLKNRHILHEKHLTSNILTLSVGYGNESVETGMEPEEIIKLADRALYQVKKNNKNGFAGMKQEKT